jgi:hypothetical protein
VPPANEATDDQEVSRAITERHPVLITTVSDLAPTADVERLTKVFDEVRR